MKWSRSQTKRETGSGNWSLPKRFHKSNQAKELSPPTTTNQKLQHHAIPKAYRNETQP